MATQEVLNRPSSEGEAAQSRAIPQRRWDLAFIGIIGWCIIEYTRLPAMYPVLQVLQLGKVVIALAVVGVLATGGSRVSQSPEVRRVGFFLLWFQAATIISTIFANFQGMAWDGFILLLQWAVVYWLLSQVVISTWRLRTFLFVYLVLMLKLAQHAIRYYAQARTMYDEMVVVTHGAGGGSTGFFANSADFGLGMCVVWPIAVCLLFGRPRGLFKLLLWVSAIVILISIMICGSRGAVVGVAAIGVCFVGRSPSRLAVPLVLLLLLPGIFAVLPEASKERFRSAIHWEKDATASHRVVLWKAGLQIFKDNPIFGVGPRNYPMTHHLWYSQGEVQRSVSVAHSSYVELITEWGLFGTLPMVGLWFWVFRINKKTRQLLLRNNPKARRTFEYCLSRGLELGLVGYLVSGAFISVIEYPHVWLLLGLSAGLNTAVRTENTTAVVKTAIPAWPLEHQVAPC
jgi:putative inorganic carbon (HCO3(-)) transporter